MNKKSFLNICDQATEQGKGIIVFVKIPGNEESEVILNGKKDVLNKKEYYDKTYDDDMKHKNAPIEIVDIKIEYLGLDDVKTCDLFEELKKREGVEAHYLSGPTCKCEISTFEGNETVIGPCATILVVTD